LSAQLVVDAKNDMFGESVGRVVRGPGRIELLSKSAPSAKQIAEAEYDPANTQVRVIFQDGTTEQVKL
jgi:hypothetical protein